MEACEIEDSQTLLENPLTLNLLLGARENNEWPNTLSETFHLWV